jgi:hypothetical protein
MSRFQQYINNLKSNGYEIINYVRKSYGKEDRETRVRLLQSMINRMFERLLANKIYASPLSHADEPSTPTYLNYNDTILKELNKVEDTTQYNTVIVLKE